MGADHLKCRQSTPSVECIAGLDSDHHTGCVIPRMEAGGVRGPLVRCEIKHELASEIMMLHSGFWKIVDPVSGVQSLISQESR